MDLNLLSIDAARSAVQERRTTAVSLAEALYSKIETDDQEIGAYLTLSKERALAKAAKIDALAAKGEKLPPLGAYPSVSKMYW
jgi:aspartyl-tRNA(Asn)/glutamyl-tRNA(Gln) amidotransferase subunit A